MNTDECVTCGQSFLRVGRKSDYCSDRCWGKVLADRAPATQCTQCRLITFQDDGVCVPCKLQREWDR